MKKYDVSLKELILGAERELLKFAGLDVSELEAINVEIPTVKEKRVDVAYRCSMVSGTSIIVQAEFQLYYEKNFAVRMLGYWTDLKSKFPEDRITQIVFTYGVKINNLIDEGDNISFVKYGFTVIDLSEIPFEKYLGSENPSINALGILSKDCDVRKLIEKIFEYELEKSKIVSLIDKIYILSKLSEREEEVQKTVEEIHNIDIRELKIFQIGEKEGLEKGLKEGLEKGLKEGLELMIKMKFGNKGENFISKIREIDDIEKLRKIARSVAKSKSLKELEKILANKK